MKLTDLRRIISVRIMAVLTVARLKFATSLPTVLKIILGKGS